MLGALVTSYAQLVVRYRWAFLVALVGATAILGGAVTRLRVEIDPDSQLPQDHPFIQTLNDVHRMFGDKNLVVIGLFPRDGQVFTPPFLRKLSEITDRVSRLPGANPALVQSIAAPQIKAIRGTQDGIEVEAMLESLPDSKAGADAVRERVAANPAYLDTLVSPDGSAAAVQVSFELTAGTPGYRHLHQAVLEVLRSTDDGTFDYRLSGPVVFLAELASYTARMSSYFLLALLVIGLIHYHAFRTLQALLLPLVTALLSVVWALGLMGLLGIPLDPYNATTPILILAVAAGHAVQILKRFYEEFDRSGDVCSAVVSSLAAVGPVMLAAGTIASLSFFSLATFGTATIRTFGVFTGLGILSAMAIELTAIPALRTILPSPRGQEQRREAETHPLLDSLLGFAAWATRTRPWIVVGGSGCIVLASALLATRVEVDTSLKRYFGPKEPVRLDDAAINGKFAGTNTLTLLVEGPDEGALDEPALVEAILRLERSVEKEHGVGKAISYVDLLSTIHVAMNADRPGAGVLPASKALIAQYLFLYSLSGGADGLDTMLDSSHKFAKVRILVHEDSTQYGVGLIEKVQRMIEGDGFPRGYRVRYTGSLASTAAVTQRMVEGKLLNIAQVACITLLVATLLLRSLVGGLLVAIPLAIAVAVNFGVMGLFRMPLDTTTSAIAAMAVGIGADYAIYLLFRVREECRRGVGSGVAISRALATSGKAVIFVSTAIAFGYGTLCLSGFRSHMQLGGLVALAMLVSAASTLFVLPALIALVHPRFLETTVDGSEPSRPGGISVGEEVSAQA